MFSQGKMIPEGCTSQYSRVASRPRGHRIYTNLDMAGADE